MNRIPHIFRRLINRTFQHRRAIRRQARRLDIDVVTRSLSRRVIDDRSRVERRRSAGASHPIDAVRLQIVIVAHRRLEAARSRRKRELDRRRRRRHERRSHRAFVQGDVVKSDVAAIAARRREDEADGVRVAVRLRQIDARLVPLRALVAQSTSQLDLGSLIGFEHDFERADVRAVDVVGEVDFAPRVGRARGRR